MRSSLLKILKNWQSKIELNITWLLWRSFNKERPFFRRQIHASDFRYLESYLSFQRQICCVKGYKLDGICVK